MKRIVADLPARELALALRRRRGERVQVWFRPNAGERWHLKTAEGPRDLPRVARLLAQALALALEERALEVGEAALEVEPVGDPFRREVVPLSWRTEEGGVWDPSVTLYVGEAFAIEEGAEERPVLATR